MSCAEGKFAKHNSSTKPLNLFHHIIHIYIIILQPYLRHKVSTTMVVLILSGASKGKENI